jgi:hypothetical protein
MEKIKEQLKEQYDTSIDFFNKGDYEHYFFHVRKSVELIGKFLIHDTLKNKGEEEKAYDIISGNYSFTLDNYHKVYLLTPNPQQRDPEGSFFITLAKYTMYYAFPALFNPGQFPKLKRIKVKIDTCLDEMIEYYNTSSEIVMHTAHSSLDEKAQADSCAAFFVKAFNDLKSQISEEATAFLSSLDLPNKNEIKQNIEIEKAIQANNGFSVLDDITNSLEQSTDDYYVALLPEKLQDNYGHTLSKERLQDVFRLNWQFIVDLNKKTSDGLYEQAPSSKKSSIRIITDNISEVTGASNLINWLFAKGRADQGNLDDKATLKNTPRLFSKTFSKLVKTGFTKDYIIFDFCDNAFKLTEKLFDKLEDVFDDWDAVANRCKIISFTSNLAYKERLTEWSKYTGVQVFFVEATFADFLVHINELKPNKEVSESKILLRGKKLDISEARERYHAAGIDFYCPSKNKSEKPQWDFYSGAEITWEELEQQCDVQRDLYRIVRSKITELIHTIRKTSIFTLRHRPGSGATTLAKRLGYDITKDDESGVLSCTAVDIKNCSNLHITDQYLCQLSEITENTPILAIVESKHIGREKFDYLVKRMSDAGKKIVFFYIEPYTGSYHSQNENVVYLESTLKATELLRFEEKYKHLGLNASLLESQKKQNKSLEVVDFPLMLKDNETSNNLGSYVQEWMGILPDNLVKFCAFVGFVFKYSDLGVNQTLLKSIWKVDEQFSIMSYPFEIVCAIKKLLIEETIDGSATGIWRPRYNRFSTFILGSYKSNWESGLSEMAKEFISLCQDVGELGSDDKDMLYSVFVIRKNADYRALEDCAANIKNKFSLLVKDLNDIERAESLFSSLVDAFPEDAVFRGHFARFLYEKATMSNFITTDDRLFIDAQDQLHQAFDINPNDTDLYHMQGMLLRRRINALSKMFQRDLRTKDFEEIDIRAIRDCLEDWVQQAYDAFEKSIQLSPASPYGYAAESQLFKEAIELGQKLLQSADYSFCETDYIFSEYTEKLGIVLDLFEQICYAFKNEGLTQILNSYRIYESVRAYHENLVGRNTESINKYRKMYSNACDEKKLFYGNLLLKSIVYSKTSTKNTRTAYKNLTKQERHEIENILEFQRNKGDVKSYETMFMLKLYSSEDYSLDEAIDLLKEWESQYDENSQLGWGYLNVCFYLAVCYCAKSIKRAVPNLELTSLASTYFKKSEDFAKKFDKGTVSPQCYLGERNDIHCIIDKNMKDTDADKVTGVIHHINNNKGILKMLCGVEVTFNAKGFDILHDEGQTLCGHLGFRYSGPGLYDFRPENVSESTEIFDVQDETEITFKDLEKSFVPAEDLVEEVVNGEATEEEKPQLKVVGSIDLSKVDKKYGKVHGEENKKKLRGFINNRCDRVNVRNFSYIVDKNNGFAPNCSPSQYYYRNNEEVIFDIFETINPRTNKPFGFAINIKPACED